MGKENFPSERSSAKPLFAEYWYQVRHGSYAEIGANLVIPKIHIVISYLKVDTN
jgi:hypothetical protein